MYCSKRNRPEPFTCNKNDSICVNKNEIYFQIYDETNRVYICNLIISNFVRVIISQDKDLMFDQENCQNNEFEIHKYKTHTRITGIRNKNKILKIINKNCKIHFYHLNRNVLELCIFKKSNGHIFFETSFISIEKFYGLPERASLSKLVNDTTYRLYNTDEFLLALNTEKPLYGSIPFLMGCCKTHSIGILWNNESETKVKLQKRKRFFKRNKSVAQWCSENWSSEMICLIDKKSIDVQKMFMGITGCVPLPQLFALGYHQCRWNYEDQKDVFQVDADFDKARIPYDVIWLDIEHTDGKRYMTWDKEKFKSHELVQYLKGKHRHLVVIIDPHLKVDDGYFLYREAKSNNYLINDEDGSNFVGECWPSKSSWVDFINDDACLWWSTKITNYLQDLNGINRENQCNNVWVWIDMNEPSVFNCPDNQLKPTAKHVAGTIDHREVHNVYGQKMAKATFTGILDAYGGNLRPFLLSRSFHIGSQKYGATWTGDSEASWAHLKISVSMMISLSICGMEFCGSDVGGFFGDPSEELLTRWYQLSSTQPFFRAHCHIESKRREPYLIDEPFGKIIKEAINFRYQILAHWYLLFWLAEIKNDPIVSPVWMFYPSSYYYNNNDDMFMIGADILVRPIVTSGCQSITLKLPGKGDLWYQYCSKSSDWKIYKGENTITIPISLESFPVFYRGGCCIFMKEGPCSNTFDWQLLPYSIFIFPSQNKSSTGYLYIDDYCTYDYKKKSHFVLFHVTFSPSEGTLVCKKEDGNFKGLSLFNQKIVRIIIVKNKSMSWTDCKTMSLDGNRVDQCIINESEDKIIISNFELNLQTLSNSVVLSFK